MTFEKFKEELDRIEYLRDRSNYYQDMINVNRNSLSTAKNKGFVVESIESATKQRDSYKSEYEEELKRLYELGGYNE